MPFVPEALAPFLAPYGAQRVAGLAAVLTGSMSAAREPLHHRLLHRTGILGRLPSTWPEAEVLSTMPWGGRPFTAPPTAPPPERPPGVAGPWPQAPVVHRGFSAPVLELPPEEERAHRDYLALRYLGQASTRWPAAALRAVTARRLLPVTDPQFASLLQDTLYAQWIHAGLDPVHLDAFGHVLEGAPEDHHTLDLWAVADMETVDPELHLAPCTVLLKRNAAGTRYRVLAVRVGERTVQPHEGPAWALARYFVLLAAATLTITIWHPRLHFPHDTFHAVTRALLPDGHPIRRIVDPHTRLTLGLHKAVVHHRRSVVHNSQRELYTPFAATTESIHRGVALGIAGMPGRRGFPAFRWGDDLPGTHTTYGQYRQEWAEAIRRFCDDALQAVPADDPLVREWATHIAKTVPGFPDAEAIRRPGALADAVSVWLRGVTVFHTADHHSFAQIPLGHAPLRLRTPPPDQVEPSRFDPQHLVSREDHLRRQLAHEMFFRPSVVYALADVRYDLGDPGIADRFTADMAALDARWASSPFPSSREIAASIHY